MTQRKFAHRAALFDRPAVLFLPASKPRMIEKARDSGADMVILDLEDAVAIDDKESARQAAVEAVASDWPMPVAIRVNGVGTNWHIADVQAVAGSGCDMIILPLVSAAEEVAAVADRVEQPVAAMIETARGVLAAPDIAEIAAALIVGTNDLAADLRIPAGHARASMRTAIEQVVLAARARGIACYDGVYNRIDDTDGFLAEAREGHALGFDGKTLIHPAQIAPCHAAFAPSEADIDRAKRLLLAAQDECGAVSFEGEMVEAMHVASARRLLERAGVGESSSPA
ncbi:HpcH/HpaI aldolase/citrate lyase family protein [Sphingomicrobium flavum]|uniref:HpcH/HpaI aldolase/citrate lyase family protein n=1 Tax=Sphingomicrobium flavum TaxID=1229164 RepID=UPI0021AE1C8D|nr:CoA ester lyase [Sphingomicrobium flavum]